MSPHWPKLVQCLSVSAVTSIKNQSLMQRAPPFFGGALSTRRIGRNFLVTDELRSVSSALLTSSIPWVISLQAVEVVSRATRRLCSRPSWYIGRFYCFSNNRELYGMLCPLMCLMHVRCYKLFVDIIISKLFSWVMLQHGLQWIMRASIIHCRPWCNFLISWCNQQTPE